MNRLLPILLLASLAACNLTTYPETARPYEPLPMYDDWWSEVESLSGIDGDLARVRWYQVIGEWVENGKPVYGRRYPDDRIYIADGYLHDECIIKHEMLHSILRGDPTHQHPLFRSLALCPITSSNR